MNKEINFCFISFFLHVFYILFVILLLVMKVNTYTIYKLNTNNSSLLEHFPNIKNTLLSLKPSNPFFSQQLEALFDSTSGINEYLYAKLSARNDYQRVANMHTICNQITKETIQCKVHDYAIEISANQKSNIFFDILYQKSKRYVIMDEQCKNQEV